MKKNIYKKLILIFFATMALFTIISRMVDSVMIAKVSTGRSQRKTITSWLEGNAIIEAGDIALITIADSYQIDQVFVMSGSKITPETELFQYQINSIEKARKNVQTELDKLFLELEQTQLNAQIIPSISEAEVSQLEIQVSEKELVLAQTKYQEKQTQYQDNIIFLEDEYQKKRDLSEYELSQQKEKAYRSSEQSYQTAKANRDTDVKDAKRQIEDAKKELKRLEDEDEDEDKIADAQDTLERSQEDLSDILDQWEDTLGLAKEQMILEEDQASDISNGWTSSQISLDDEYRLKLEQEENLIQDAKDAIVQAQSNLELAQKRMALSHKKDTATQAETVRQKKITELTQKSIQIDIENMQLEITAMNSLIEQGGIIKASCSGTVVKMGIEIGQITTGAETIQIAIGNFRIRGAFQKDGDISIQTGNDVTISLGAESFPAVVDVVDLSHNEQGEFVANINFEDATVGMTVQYTYSEKTSIYQSVLPLEAIHKDLKGYYCLIVQENNGILGTDFSAARVNLEVVFSGTEDAAVEGNLGDETQIIVETDTIIQEGDRIRLVNNYAKS